MRQSQPFNQTAERPIVQCKNLYYLHQGWLELIAKAAKECGLELNNYLSQEQAELIGRDVRQLRKVHQQLMADSKQEKFSLIAAKFIEPLTFDSYSLLLWTAPDVHTMLESACRYAVCVGAPVHLSFTYNWKGDIELWLVNREPRNSESVVSYVGMTLFLAVIIELLYKTTQVSNLGLEAALTSWPYQTVQPEDFAHELNCKISLGSVVRKIFIPRAVLHQPQATANADIFSAIRSVVIKQATAVMAEDIVLQIYRWLDEHDSLADLNIQDLAAWLSVSVRTLNRRLASAGTTYRHVSESYKLERALHWLSVEKLSVTDVAYRLGFADLSTFSRAFKRWTGCSPSHLGETS